CSEKVAEFAWQWAEITGESLHLLHDISQPFPYFASSSLKEEWLRRETNNAREQLIDLAEKLTDNYKRIKVHVSNYGLNEKIDLLNTQNSVDCIFAGLKGTGLVKKVVLGSKIIRLSENLDLPMVVVTKDSSSVIKINLQVAVSINYPFNV